MDEPTAFFVYGTLKRGQLNCSLLQPYARSIERAQVHGRLFDVGLFPALIEGQGTVHGELVRVRRKAISHVLSLVDRLEDFRPGDPAGSMYIRRVVDATTEAGDRERAYAYFYNCEHALFPPPESLLHLEGGEWPCAERRAVEGHPEGTRALHAFEHHVRTYRETVERDGEPIPK